MFVKLIEKPIIREDALSVVRHPSCGAVVTFEGDIRVENQGKKVLGLEYEVYETLFHFEVRRIAEEIKEKWAIRKFALIQRVGRLEVGETGVFLAISSPHRREALEALSYAIEEFKRRAPVWKKEYYQDDEQWIGCAH